jgi:hypothetical protein
MALVVVEISSMVETVALWLWVPMITLWFLKPVVRQTGSHDNVNATTNSIFLANGTAGEVRGSWNRVTNAGTAITDSIGFDADVWNGGGTTANAYGGRFTIRGSGVTNGYGIFINDVSATNDLVFIKQALMTPTFLLVTPFLITKPK